jgi:DNA-binding MarR family transcriptional regulator
MVTLAKALGSSRLSHAVDRLQRSWWVRRASHPSDRRGQLAVLTDLGYQRLEAAAPGHVAAVRAQVIDLRTRVKQLGEISQTLSTAAAQAPSQSQKDAPAARTPTARPRFARPPA